MDVIELTRELGKAIQNDDRYIAYQLAKQVNDEDTQLQEDISRFETLRLKLNRIMSSSPVDNELMKKTDGELKEVYRKVMQNPNMIVFNSAQNALESLISNINQIISLCANGEDPETCQPSSQCGGNCATCGGCG